MLNAIVTQGSPHRMEWASETPRWTRPAAIVALLVLAIVMLRAPQPGIVAPPDAVSPFDAPVTLSEQFERQAAPLTPASPLDGRESVATIENVSLYTSAGSYTAEQVRAMAGPIHDALRYVEDRTALRLSGPVSIIFDRRELCALDGAAYTERRVILLYACPDLPPQRAINILAHEFVHQLAHDRYGPAHLRADLILSEGLATWGAGSYWLGGAQTFREFVSHSYGDRLLPIGAHYRDYGSIDAMNRLYYQWASVVEWTLETHGRDAFDRLYASGSGPTPATADYMGVLGGDLGAVEAAWRAWLAP
jgi:hypothetical protein